MFFASGITSLSVDPFVTVLRFQSCRRRHIVEVLGGDTGCLLQVCLLSRFSTSTHFVSRVVVKKQLHYVHTAPETDSTIPLPQNQRFYVTNVSWLLGTRKDALTKTSSRIFLFAKEGP